MKQVWKYKCKNWSEIGLRHKYLMIKMAFSNVRSFCLSPIKSNSLCTTAMFWPTSTYIAYHSREFYSLKKGRVHCLSLDVTPTTSIYSFTTKNTFLNLIVTGIGPLLKLWNWTFRKETKNIGPTLNLQPRLPIPAHITNIRKAAHHLAIKVFDNIFNIFPIYNLSNIFYDVRQAIKNKMFTGAFAAEQNIFQTALTFQQNIFFETTFARTPIPFMLLTLRVLKNIIKTWHVMKQQNNLWTANISFNWILVWSIGNVNLGIIYKEYNSINLGLSKASFEDIQNLISYPQWVTVTHLPFPTTMGVLCLSIVLHTWIGTCSSIWKQDIGFPMEKEQRTSVQTILGTSSHFSVSTRKGVSWSSSMHSSTGTSNKKY